MLSTVFEHWEEAEREARDAAELAAAPGGQIRSVVGWMSDVEVDGDGQDDEEREKTPEEENALTPTRETPESPVRTALDS